MSRPGSPNYDWGKTLPFSFLLHVILHPVAVETGAYRQCRSAVRGRHHKSAFWPANGYWPVVAAVASESAVERVCFGPLILQEV